MMNQTLWNEFLCCKKFIKCETKEESKRFLELLKTHGVKIHHSTDRQIPEESFWGCYKGEAGLIGNAFECWEKITATFKQLMDEEAWEVRG